MAAEGKKSMTAVLDIDPRTEMDDKVVKWINGHPLLKKEFPNYTYKETLELDPRKWDEKKLRKGLEALVRYELKILAHRVTESWKTVQKEGAKAETSAVKDLAKQYAKIGKEIDNKCSLALEEIAADRPDNKKGLRDGKAALKKLEGADFAKAFSGPRETVTKAFHALSSALAKATGNDKAEQAAYVDTAKSIDEARREFDGNAKDAEAAVDFLMKKGREFAKGEGAWPDLGKMIGGYEREFNDFLSHVRAFDVDIDAAANDVKQRKLTPSDATRKAKGFDDHARLDKEGKDILAVIKEISKKLAEIEKDGKN